MNIPDTPSTPDNNESTTRPGPPDIEEMQNDVADAATTAPADQVENSDGPSTTRPGPPDIEN